MSALQAARVGDHAEHTQAAMERAMKVQEVILRAMAKKISSGGDHRHQRPADATLAGAL